LEHGAQSRLEYAKQTDWYALIALAISTGMRQGELFGLSPDDIDRKAKTVSIRRQAIEPKGTPSLADLKTRRSRRTLDLTDTTLSAVVDHLAARMRRGHARAETLFCSEAGTIMSKTNFRRRVWLPLLKKAKLSPRGFHQTRHTYATLALLSGVPITVVSAVMGHAQPSITLNVYSHVLEGSQQLSTDVMEKLLG